MKNLIALGVATLTATSSLSSFAQEERNIKIICDQTSKITATLSKEYKEQPVVVGKGQNMVVSVWFSAEGNTWTIITSFENGKSCILADGTDLAPVQRQSSGNLKNINK